VAPTPGERILRRPILLVPLAVIVTLALAHTLVWEFAGSRLRNRYAVWIEAMRARGWTVTADAPVAGGWPIAVALRVANMRITGGEDDIPGGLEWRAGRVELSVALLSPNRLAITPSGAQRVRIGRAPDVPYTADALRVVLPLADSEAAGSAELGGTNLRPVLAFSATPVSVAAMTAHLDWNAAAGRGEPALALAVGMNGVNLPPLPAGRAWPLGPAIRSATVEAALSGPVPAAADVAAQSLLARATGWRDGGGGIDVARFGVSWGPLDLSGDATLSLDAQLQPAGSGTMHAAGQSETLDMLVANRAINRNTEIAVRALLGLLARTPADGGPPEVDLPVTLKGRTLSAGGFPVAKVPEVIWQP
jgi:hypothetical protein